MVTENAPKKISPAKLVVIGVLVIVLGYVLLKPGDKPSPQPTANASPPASRFPGKQPGGQPAAKPGEPVATKPLPESSMANTVRYNPFEFGGEKLVTVALALKPTRQRTQSKKDRVRQQQARDEMLNALRQQNVDIILETPKGKSARVGNRIIHEGKKLRDGARVRRIQRNGVVVEVPADIEPTGAPAKEPPKR